jgi:hypothetical protein
MMNARQEMKELTKAIDIITEILESPKAKESDMVLGVLNDAELSWRRRYMELQKATARKPARKKAGAS